ncbi:hypothetical protein BS47DRAFT_902001 [Hydnum rufescens UP504]|uniref:Uncharacterized protein n=1 Tax=Hydnum rufescens UP504 TaxID=1448309 RepID=A0A9P6AC09_9AGAM|nr:hypothetical protein BS47DRAFT_902001 [Hydnum rufescens UP504]
MGSDKAPRRPLTRTLLIYLPLASLLSCGIPHGTRGMLFSSADPAFPSLSLCLALLVRLSTFRRIVRIDFGVRFM